MDSGTMSVLCPICEEVVDQLISFIGPLDYEDQTIEILYEVEPRTYFNPGGRWAHFNGSTCGHGEDDFTKDEWERLVDEAAEMFLLSRIPGEF